MELLDQVRQPVLKPDQHAMSFECRYGVLRSGLLAAAKDDLLGLPIMIFRVVKEGIEVVLDAA